MNVRTLFFVAVLFASCAKEESLEITDNPGPAADKLKGSYTFLYMQAHTESIVEATDGTDSEKMVSVSDYITKNNVGSVTIDAGKFSAISMGYSVDTIVKGYFYVNGILDDSMESDFRFTAPPMNSVAPYKLVGTDSLYFTGGIVSLPSGGGGVASPESKARFAFSGDTLILYQGYYDQSSTMQGTVKFTQTNAATMVLKLKKK